MYPAISSLSRHSMSGLTALHHSKLRAASPSLSIRDTRDGANVISSGNTIFVCTADQAGKVLEYDVTFSVFGDGIRYQAVWSPEHTIKHSITCSVGPTPTPDPTLPKAPAHSAGITTRAANYEGKLVEVVVAVERVPNVDLAC